MDQSRSGCSAVRVAYLNGVQVVAGSNPVIPTINFPGLPGFFVSMLRNSILPMYLNPLRLYVDSYDQKKAAQSSMPGLPLLANIDPLSHEGVRIVRGWSEAFLYGTS